MLERNDTIAHEIEHGETLFVEGKMDECRKYFIKLLGKQPSNPDILNNLGAIYYALGKQDTAEAYFRRAIEFDAGHLDARTNLTDLLKSQGRGPEAVPHREKLDDLNEAECKKKNLLFLEAPGNGDFLDCITKSLAGEYSVKRMISEDNKEINDLINWADIVWLEWANQMAVHATNSFPQLKDKTVICRLHGYEVFTEFPARINWDVVDRLVFVARHKQEIFHTLHPGIRVEQSVIRNGVDVSQFSIPFHKKNTKNLLLLGHLNYRKGLPLLVQFYHELLKRDPGYHLYVRGAWQDLRYKLSVETMIHELRLENNITFTQEWIPDLNEWLRDKSHILSFSLEESFHYAIGNCMAAGLKPAIHAWKESREIWPEEFIFNDLAGFLELMLNSDFEPERYRDILGKRALSASDQVNAILGMLRLHEKDIQPSDGPQTNNPVTSGQATPRRDVPTKEARPVCGSRAGASKQGKSDSQSRMVKKWTGQDAGTAFTTENPLGLLLRNGEAIRDYMNLAYHLCDPRSEISEETLLCHLQAAFHQSINTYFNAFTISRSDMEGMTAICKRLREYHDDFSLESGSPEAMIAQIFGFLKEHLPGAGDLITIRPKKWADHINRSSVPTVIRNLYSDLRDTFAPLYTKEYMSTFLIHGSLSTLDYTPFSDVDTQIFLSDKVFSSHEILRQTAQRIAEANVLLRLHDPLQHHGYFIATDLDRQLYPEAFLPLDAMSNGTIILGQDELSFSPRQSSYENMFSLWHLAYFFRISYVTTAYPKTLFDSKRFLSRFSMLPSLFLEVFENKFPYKRDSFDLARPYFPQEIWDIYDTVTRVRGHWSQTRLMDFNSTFYRRIYNFSEHLLELLRELSNGDSRY